MRYIPLCLGLLLLCSCVRDNVMVTPDRGDHAWNLRGENTNMPGAKSTTYRQPPRAGERVITLAPDQKLWMVAEDYGVDLYQLIERNDFTTDPYPGAGTKVIVPDREPRVR